MTVTIRKWGNSLGLRLPKAVAQSAGIELGSEIDLKVEDGRIVLEPVDVPSLGELLSQVKRSSRPDLADWGEPAGKEAW